MLLLLKRGMGNMRGVIFASATALAMVQVTPTGATSNRTTVELLSVCGNLNPTGSIESKLNAAQCVYYVDGIMDAHTILVGWKFSRPLYCFPVSAR